MRIGLLADVHANAPALRAVLRDLPDVDALAVAGDVVGYGPHPAACVDLLRERDAVAVRGNHDRVVASGGGFESGMAAAGAGHARRELTDEQRAWLGDLPDSRRAFDGRVRLAHGHPDDPDRYVYPGLFAPDLLTDAAALVLGHTHVQAAERFLTGVVVNPGSVGQPRDGDSRAAYAVLETDDLAVDLRRVEYDVGAVARDARAAGLPAGTWRRLEKGR